MFLVFKDPSAVAQFVSERLVQLIKDKPAAILGLATGSTMEPVYARFCQDVKAQGLDVSQLSSFNLDEYIGLSADHPQSYHYYMNRYLFDHLNFAKSKTFVPDGTPVDVELHCEQYSQKIMDNGGIDLQLLGVGANGHIGFNEPGTPFDSRTHVIDLSVQTRIDNSRFFDSMDEVPTHAVTMGMKDIMEAKQILFIATGANKADVVAALYASDYDEQMPASMLKRHPNTLFIIDEKAAAQLPASAVQRMA
ncbi:glucosamine-6-phosphate deaminase [Oligella urethralis]|uniref:glucosamine-6-phosphate deaminase n=1 Tax=Oligella urethralis TaxID=90245 RepID=UPI000CFF0B27|nr:glucosamine-6-phosphate deaminase [Oligella urethralis]AVL71498.1 glucosamine-6-phosphate deaminase [Oligella urethralis]